MCSYLSAQKVTNVDFFQSGSNVVITYNLDVKSDIQLFVSINGGNTYTGPLKEVSGAVGPAVMPGKALNIVWNVLAETSSFGGERVVFKVEAKKCKIIKPAKPKVVKAPKEVKKTPKPKTKKYTNKWRTLISAYTSANLANTSNFSADQMSYGLMIGGARTCGFYVKGKTNFSFQKPSYSVLNKKYVNSNAKSKVNDFNIVAGALIGLTKSFYLYAGVGYGSRVLLWEDTNNQWAKLKEYSSSGFVFDIGCMAYLGKFSLSLGINATLGDKKYLVPELGIGVMF